MKIGLIFGVLLVVLISGCTFEDKIGGPYSLKNYLTSDLPNTDSKNIIPPGGFLVRAEITDITLCSEIELPPDVSNDCFINGEERITLKDLNEDFSKSFGLMEYGIVGGGVIGDFPLFALDLLKEGEICNFLFDGNIIEDVIVCDGVSREELDIARNK